MIRPLRSWLRITLVVMNVIVAAGFVSSAYAGIISPDVTPAAGLLAMTFVLWLPFVLIALVVDLFMFRRLAWMPFMAMVVCAGPLRTYFPINIVSDDNKQGTDGRFTVLTYNVEGFIDQPWNHGAEANRTMRYILDVDADVVCLQECMQFKALEGYGLTQEQVDSMYARYPYVDLHFNSGQAIFSKYPFTVIDLEYPDFDTGDFKAYSMTVDGHPLTLFNVHLQSLSLTEDDRQLYLTLTKEPSELHLKQAKSQLIPKLCHGFRQRAIQAGILCDFIERIGGNFIVCGDFNDVPGCYAIRQLEKTGLRDAYTDAAFGPTITYHVNRFYFRIDQALYKGSFKAVGLERGNVDSSDHYPLLITFKWNKPVS